MFIKWNEFKHESEKKLKIVYDHDIPRLFVEFARNAPANKLNRINLIMHAWALWSVGQLKA